MAAATAPPTKSPGSNADRDLIPVERTILRYNNYAQDRKTTFVVRIARYRPDIVLEWENLSDQGTVHLYRKAVEQGDGFTLAGHFQVGVQVESKDIMTLWLSRRSFEELRGQGKVSIKLNRLPLKMQLRDQGLFSLEVNKQSVELPVIHVTDDRRGQWTFYDNAENPLLVAYQSPYFRQELAAFSSGTDQKLRWIKKLPPIQ